MVLMIIKIVISTPTVLILTPHLAHGSALMGGYIDNTANSTLPNFLLDPSGDGQETTLNVSFNIKFKNPTIS